MFLLRNVAKKVSIFSAQLPIQKIHQRVARRGMCPLLFGGGLKGGGVPLSVKKILDL
jgi:hypothetical protein